MDTPHWIDFYRTYGQIMGFEYKINARSIGFIVTSILSMLLTACDSPSLRIHQFDFGSTKALSTTGGVRLVTERMRSAGPNAPFLPVVCTEPSPDYALAISQSFDGNAKVARAQTSIEGGLKVTTAETATELEGRTAGVLALRDGLYAACQAYVNGVIGHDAYAMILSQYGTLLVSLTAPSGVATGATPYDPAKRAALSTLLVGCISEFDPTRVATSQNPLFDPRFCKDVMRRSLTYGAGAGAGGGRS